MKTLLIELCIVVHINNDCEINFGFDRIYQDAARWEGEAKEATMFLGAGAIARPESKSLDALPQLCQLVVAVQDLLSLGA
jgi:hypothetical protein